MVPVSRRPFPAVGLDDDALTAARLMAERKLPGIIVCHGDGSPHTILPGSQVLRFVIPPHPEAPRTARAAD